MIKFTKEQMAKDVKVIIIPENKKLLEDETFKIEMKTLQGIKTIYLTKKDFYLKNVLLPSYFNKREFSISFLRQLAG
jgi:hypothetical protein